jgi:hypothetical protein
VSLCKFCPQNIFWSQINGRFKPFDDSNLTVAHVCTKLKSQKTLEQKIQIMIDDIVGLKNLNSKILTKINKLEQWREQNES